ncbi:MAG: YgjV family protein [Erysipelotrichaceae bacterium]|nr:YgjV family protein [Erysipelotrichaceae bacterium]
MTKETIIEAVGYLGSFLVLVSFLMTSVVKLRIVNTVGSLIFMIYALIIHSYPTAVMNACLVMINLRFLWKISKTERELDLVRMGCDSPMADYLLNYYREDIEKCFPGVSLDFAREDAAYVVICDGKPVGLSVGRRESEIVDLLLDYSIPQYRDASIGTYLYQRLKEEGVRTIIYSGPTVNHLPYLERQGFTEKDGHYELKL